MALSVRTYLPLSSFLISWHSSSNFTDFFASSAVICGCTCLASASKSPSKPNSPIRLRTVRCRQSEYTMYWACPSRCCFSAKRTTLSVVCISSKAVFLSSVVSAWLNLTSATKNSVSCLPRRSPEATFGMLWLDRFLPPFITRLIKSFALKPILSENTRSEKAGFASFFAL